MKRIILLLSLFILVVACTPTPDTTPNLEPQELLDKEELKEIDKIVEEKAKEQPPKPVEKPKPTGGEVGVKAHTKAKLPALDEPLDVEMSADGKFSYKIAENGVVSGSGKATVIIDIKAPFSDSGDCSAHEEVEVEFSVSGAYQFNAEKLLYFSHDPKPDSISVTLTCPYAGTELTYELPIPLYFFAGEEGKKVELVFTGEPKLTKKIVHPVPAWEDEVEAEWEFEDLKPLEDFDFDVDVDPPIVSIKQGGSTDIQVVVKHVRGTPQAVMLTHTSWDPLVAQLANNQLIPAPGFAPTTSFTVSAKCDTPADTYLYTLQGDAGVIKQSVDSVSVVVEADPTCT